MSARAVTDRDAVLRAIAEHDRLGREGFLERHGFARATRYELVHEGRDYDPAAILAVAHREQHGRVLEASEVTGENRVLVGLGFEIVDNTPPWREEEMVLALDVYLRHRGERIPRTHPEAVALSETLQRLAELHGHRPRGPFRNPEGMEQQLGAFLDLDPVSTKRGRGKTSKLHRATWERYASDGEALRRRVVEITSALEAIPRRRAPRYEPAMSQARDAPRPRQKVTREALSVPFDVETMPSVPQAAEPTRPDPEAQHRANVEHRELRLALAGFLHAQGFTCRNPRDERKDLLYDLLALRRDLTLLVEVKSLPKAGDDHAQLRRGLGQVLWYRGRWREDCADPCVAVLYVEREPQDAQTWLAVCNSASVVLSWPARLGTLVDECALISMPARVRYALEP